MKLTWGEANHHARRLFIKWVSANTAQGIDLDRIQASIRRELRGYKVVPGNSSAALKSETRGDAILLGKIRKVMLVKTDLT